MRCSCVTRCAPPGGASEIFAEAIHDDLAPEAFKHWMYPEHAAPGDVAIYQFTTSSAVAGYLAEHGLPLILDFHNFTGPEYFAGWEPAERGAGGGGGRRVGAARPTGAARVWPRARSARRSCDGPAAGARRSCPSWRTTGG